MNKIINGDSLKVLKKLEDESVDLVCTDPPYGYSFMNRDWDKAVPALEIWQECLRVLKPGGFCFVMSAPRSDVQSRMMVRLEDAGFNIGFTPIYWTYATGFPKATNVGKAVDKKLGKKRKVVGKYKHPRSIEKGVEDKNWGDKSMSNTLEGYITQGDDKRTLEERLQITEPSSDEAKNLEGSYVGYQPKPAVEVVLVAMKPITEKTTLEQAIKNGKGITWLDDCRIPYVNEDDQSESQNKQSDDRGGFHGENTGVYSSGEQVGYDKPDGRFAANLIVQDDVLNDGVKRSKGKHTDSGSASGGIWQESTGKPAGRTYGDEGSFSRFYDLDSWWKSQIHKLPESVQKTFPFMIVAKASKAEKNKGLEHLPKKKSSSMPGRRNAEDMSNSKIDHDVTGRFVTEKQNVHPTVKPIELMSYLITLGSRENDVVVDPFVGSGTTCIAAKMLDRKYIGIEKEKDYALIAKTRLEDAESPNQPSEKNKSKDFFAF
jgi:site-specific DNA-methyltransferase (adenine-specific)